MNKTNLKYSRMNAGMPRDIQYLIKSPEWNLKYMAGRNDPALFVKHFLPKSWEITKNYPKQIQFLREGAKAQEGILRAGSRSGKTYTISMLLLYFLFYRIRPSDNHFYGDYAKTYQILNASLTLKQAKIVFYNVLDMINESPFFRSIDFIEKLNDNQSPELLTCLNSRLDIRPTTHGGRFILGQYYDVISLDEAGSEPDLNYLRFKTLGSRRVDVNGRMFFVSTPQGGSTFREVWFQLADQKKKGRKDIALGIFTAFDNPVNDPDYIKGIEKSMTLAQAQEEIYGRFADFSSSYFNIADIRKAFAKGNGMSVFVPFDNPETGECLTETNDIHNPYTAKANIGFKYYTGLDIAGSSKGSEDFTVMITIAVRNQKVKVVAYERVQRIGLVGKEGIIERVKRRLKQFRGPLFYDSSSLGGSQLTDVLSTELPKEQYELCTGISFGRKPGRSEQNNKNLMLSQLSLMFERQVITIPEDDELKALKSELRFYQLDDKKLRQDTVCALMLATWAYHLNLDENPDFSNLFDLVGNR